MRQSFAQSFRYSAGVMAAVLHLIQANATAFEGAAWPGCTLPPSCVAGDGWAAPPLDGEMGGMGMGMDAAGVPGAGQAAGEGLSLTQQFGGGGEFFVTSNTGYIDTAVPFTHLRLRYDTANNNPVPDRAEFFYGQCGCFGPDAPGPPLPERSVDYQDIRPYFEYAWSDRASVFIEAPVRFIDPVVNENHAGFSDIEAGFKWARVARPNWDYVTFQFKVYAPTGNVRQGLGTGHVSLEPGVLFFHRLTDRAVLEGEVRDWIPISDSQFNGEDFAGNVLRYGLGLGYDVVQDCNSCRQPRRLTAVTEVVGWTILNGFGFDGSAFLDAQANGGAPIDSDFVFDASGDTIVNIKVGARYTSGPKSLYVGYGRALTGDVWYENILRLEYRAAF